MSGSGIIPSPNIWHHPEVYEAENAGVDPERLIERAMWAIHDWSDQTLLDLGCGAGYHLPRWAESAASVVGVEPHPPLIAAARLRVLSLEPPARQRVRVLAGSAQSIPLPDKSADVMQARWAYFFGPGCEPGLVELARVMRRGGTAFIIDNDGSRSTFGGWFRRSLGSHNPPAVQRFWSRQGWTRIPIDMRWDFPDRATFESVVRIEFAPELAAEFLAEQPGTGVDYAVNLWWRRF